MVRQTQWSAKLLADINRIYGTPREKARLLRPRIVGGAAKRVNAKTALVVGCYNFCRVYQTLRVTPAMEARLTGHVWS
jgi:hypothetical protein